MWKPSLQKREKTTGSNQSNIPLCIRNNYKRCVFTKEKIIKKALSFYKCGIPTQRKILAFSFPSSSLVLLFLVFILHILQSKVGRQGGKVLRSYWRRTMVNRAKNSTHANGAQGSMFDAFCAHQLEFNCNVAKIYYCCGIYCIEGTHSRTFWHCLKVCHYKS